MKRNQILIILFVLIYETAPAQILRYRLSTNSTMFVFEPGNSESNHPQSESLSYDGSSDFSPRIRMGAEAEVTAPITSDFEMGLEFDYSRLSGYTPKAPMYNFFLSRQNPLPDTNPYPEEALIYETTQLSFLGTARGYILPLDNYMNLFVKAFAGITFTGTDFTFHDPVYRVDYDVGVLYSRGTQSNETPKKAGFNGGAGIGSNFRVSDKLDIYIDGTAAFINADIVNGVPNLKYQNEGGEESLRPTESWAMVAQVSIGLVYSAIPDRRLNRSNFTRSRKVGKGLFWNKNRKPFSKGRKR